VVWSANQPDSQTLVLTYISPDGDEGYPGTLTTVVTYTLTDNNEIKMDYELSSDKKTIANITNHNFWNLNGEGAGTINNHILQVDASRFTPVDSTLIPTGIDTVSGTPFDFRIAHKIGDLLEPPNQQLTFGKGYDHNFVLDKGISTIPEKIATITGDISGIKMDILTTEPGLQFYGGNFMQSKNILKSGTTDYFRTAFCLETQHFPDAPNQPGFPTTVIEPGKKYSSTTIYAFSIKQ
jgi:aldose 1-epimerase